MDKFRQSCLKMAWFCYKDKSYINIILQTISQKPVLMIVEDSSEYNCVKNTGY